MSINAISLSACGKHVQAWNNGNMIWTVPSSPDLLVAIAAAKDYLRRWAGDDEPEVSRELQGKVTGGQEKSWS